MKGSPHIQRRFFSFLSKRKLAPSDFFESHGCDQNWVRLSSSLLEFSIFRRRNDDHEYEDETVPPHEPRSSGRESAPSNSRGMPEPTHAGCYGSAVQCANILANSHPVLITPAASVSLTAGLRLAHSL